MDIILYVHGSKRLIGQSIYQVNGFIYGCWYEKGHRWKLQNLLLPLKFVHPPDKLVKNNNNNNNNKQKQKIHSFSICFL